MTNPPDQAPVPSAPSLLEAPPTRREVLLFGLLILAIIFSFASRQPRTVLVVPDDAARVGVVT